ncbi:hypothetical protein ACJBU6_09970 [Exserohilum turcicum]
MTAHHAPPAALSTSTPFCYFSIVPAAHFSVETPTQSPVSEPVPPSFMSASADASRVLQLQTDAAHRPAADPLQPQHRASSASSDASNCSSSSSSSASSSGLSSPATLSCCRCRRECLANMYQIGTNRYYCSHCARMTGYSAG